MFTLKSPPPSSEAEATEEAATSVVASLVDRMIAQGVVEVPDIHGEGAYTLRTGGGVTFSASFKPSPDCRNDPRMIYRGPFEYPVAAALCFNYPNSYSVDREAYVRAMAATMIAAIFAGRRPYMIRCGDAVSSHTVSP